MQTTTTTRDPRGFITPDAFEVSSELLGKPLASPMRRLAALLVDLAVIGVITLMTKSFGVVLGVVAALFFMRAGFKRTPVKGSVFGRAMRLSVGCLGMTIGVVTAVVWVAVRGDFSQSLQEAVPRVAVEGLGSAEGLSTGELISMAGATVELRTAETAQQGERAMANLADLGVSLGLDPGVVRELMEAEVPADADWADEAPEMIAGAMERALRDNPSATAVTEDMEPLPDVTGLSTEQALREYAGLVETDSHDPRREALRRRLTQEIAGVELSEQAIHIEDLEADAARSTRQLADARRDLESATSGGFLSSLRDFADELGFGFGWASLYLTVFLSWWKGQTIGKKLMGIRVVRLDGGPITWWTAFERAGGYAAGFATGLLGFAQVYWDANRQAIHDRIVGTVVVVDRAEIVADWEEAL